MNDKTSIRESLEPEVRGAMNLRQEDIAVSQAISLKRIADTLDWFKQAALDGVTVTGDDDPIDIKGPI